MISFCYIFAYLFAKFIVIFQEITDLDLFHFENL